MIKTIGQMFRIGWKQSSIAMFMVLCLLLLFHVLGVLAWNAWRTSYDVQQQLGVFLYLRDDATERGVKLMEEMKQAGLTTTFFSKDDAFRLLTKKLPNVLDQLETYGIENPLPPTIYVVYANKAQYEAMKSLLDRYQDVLSNDDHLSVQHSFEEQTWRASKLVSMMSVLLVLCFVLMGGIGMMIGVIMSYIVTNLFYRFQQQVELTALLGGSWRTVLSPFFWVIVIICTTAWLFGIGVMRYSVAHIDTYFLDVLETSFAHIYLPAGNRVVWFLLELCIVVALALFLVDRQIRVFLKKSV